MWATLPMVPADGNMDRADAIWIYGAITLVLVLAAFATAQGRALVLSNLFYAVTNQRALVCRAGYSGRLGLGCYLISCRPTPGYRIPVLPGRPYRSLQVGTLLSEDVVHPFGSGLTHPGWPPLRGRLTCPVLFEQVPDYDHVCELIEQGALASGPWGHRDRR